MSNTPVPQASILGTTFGDYEVLTLIGRGAAGTVYLARDIKLQRLVALKVLLGSVARNPAAVKTFHREAQAAAPLRHPGIVRIYAAGYLNGIPYIAMEYVEGEPLDRFIRRNGIMKWQQALFIAGQVAQALGCAHAAGVVHRDVKPANMLLDAQGNVRLTDFGIANIQRGPSKAVDDLGFIGTPHYMAPEQCDRAEVTHKADLYALGVVIYQMIAGVLPFEAENAMALVKKITNDEAPRLNRVFTDIPDDVARLVAHLLEKSPDARPESAAQVFETIQRLQQQQGGRSAIPDALSAFIREQAEIKQLSDAYKGPQGKAGRDTGHGSVQATKNFTVRRALLIAAGVIGIAGAVATAVLHPVQAAETVNAVTVWNEGDTVSIALMNTDLEWDSVVWDDKREYALTTVKGVEGSVYGGKSGALGVSLRDGASTALVTPTPITDESNVLRYVMPLAPEAHPNSQALWFLLPSPANQRAA